MSKDKIERLSIEKYNDIVFSAFQLSKGGVAISITSTFAFVYMVYLCKVHKLNSAAELISFMSKNFTRERYDFMFRNAGDKTDFAVNAASQYTVMELESFLASAPKPVGKCENDVTTPEYITNLVKGILRIGCGDTVADFGCGYGDFLFSVSQEGYTSAYGIEINDDVKQVAEIRSELFDIPIHFEKGDMFKLDENAKFDKIFSNYPLGLGTKASNGVDYLDVIRKKVPDINRLSSADWVFNSLLIDHISENGKAVAIMTNGSTFNMTDSLIREYFIKQGLVEAVIALPAKLFDYTSISTSMIVLSKNNTSVRMIDASGLCSQGRRQNILTEDNIHSILEQINEDGDISKSVPVKEIEERGYVLDPKRYLVKGSKIENGVEFGSVIRKVTRGAQLKASELDEMVSEGPTNVQYIMLANIQNGMIEDELPYLKELSDKYDKYCVGNRNLLLSKNGAPYKVAIAEVEKGKRILGNGNLFIIELDENRVHPYYIKALFDSDYGKSLLDSISVGTSLPNISLDALKKLVIPVPEYKTQERIASEYKIKMDEIKELKEKIKRTEEDMRIFFMTDK